MCLTLFFACVCVWCMISSMRYASHHRIHWKIYFEHKKKKHLYVCVRSAFLWMEFGMELLPFTCVLNMCLNQKKKNEKKWWRQKANRNPSSFQCRFQVLFFLIHSFIFCCVCVCVFYFHQNCLLVYDVRCYACKAFWPSSHSKYIFFHNIFLNQKLLKYISSCSIFTVAHRAVHNYIFTNI